jgi:MbtH protein
LTAGRAFATIGVVAHDEPDDTTVYRVVLNDEEQYSIWPLTRELPAGWRDEGTTGTKQECLDHIDVVWTDMRPLSLRRAMEADRQSS